MKKTLVIAAAVVLAAGTVQASGWRIPEQSVNSTARSGGYVAYTPAADAAYYNPANMSWLDDRAYLEVDATWINLTSITYTDDRGTAFNGDSNTENFVLPTFFAVSPFYGDFRFGLSFTAPAGLSKQWKDTYPRTFADEFTLKVFELNPTVSYRFCDNFSVGVGIRGVYADGKVKSYGTIIVPPGAPVTLFRDMEGDTWEAGFNLALTARPMKNLSLALAYRSEVDLDVSGSARLTDSLLGGVYDGDAGVSIPVPGVLAVSAAYTFFDRLTVELEYDRTYWSDYFEALDFTYPTDLPNGVLTSAFDDSKEKNWSDTDTFRISMEYDFKNDFILMAGFAVDENPAPDSTLGFELPDSDAKLYSIGVRYKLNEDTELGVAYLYDDKESRTVHNDTVEGTFENAGAHLVSIGFSMEL